MARPAARRNKGFTRPIRRRMRALTSTTVCRTMMQRPEKQRLPVLASATSSLPTTGGWGSPAACRWRGRCSWPDGRRKPSMPLTLTRPFRASTRKNPASWWTSTRGHWPSCSEPWKCCQPPLPATRRRPRTCRPSTSPSRACRRLLRAWATRTSGRTRSRSSSTFGSPCRTRTTATRSRKPRRRTTATCKPSTWRLGSCSRLFVV
mmetsp:Transcript_7099/g.19204  ORF Transcript_7099/g.19204 Transcript_7099/m.19204 type:complete len:205 (+) Transcript_7099:231-845(+)